MKQPR